MRMDKSALTVVLPIPRVKHIDELLQFLDSYGHCVTLREAMVCDSLAKTIIVGKIIEELHPYKDSPGSDKKVYYLESAAPGDSTIYRFVASGKRIINLLSDVFSVSIGDHLAIYEPRVMRNAADCPTVYLLRTKATVWVWKPSKMSKFGS